MGYQERDRHIIDYGTVRIPNMLDHPGKGAFRGPFPSGDEYIAYIGGAQTFGCYCQEPFPMLLRGILGIDSLNLGAGGAGPTFHRSSEVLMSMINKAKLVVVQMYSGRSISNSRFHITHHGMEGIDATDGRRMIASEFFELVVRSEPENVIGIVQETRRNYVKACVELLKAIRPPTILLWFSTRKPQYQEEVALPLWKLWGAFPHFVNQEMVDEIKTFAQDYVECVCSDGLPQPLLDKAGNPTTVSHQYDLLSKTETVQTHNHYYPSPEMHKRAAEMLSQVCARYLKGDKCF